MKTKFTLIIFLMANLLIAQSGINYKALIKDDGGNVISNQLITVQFNILQSLSQVSVYEETHTPTTDANGIINLIIGQGSTTDNFNLIDWGFGDMFLNVAVDTGNGLVDLGTTEFQLVPYAYVAVEAVDVKNIPGLESIDEGNGLGWRLAGVVNDGSEGYGAIGNGATDLSVSDANGASLLYPYGASGNGSFVTGENTIGFGNYSVALGQNSLAIGNHSNAMGNSTSASGASAFSAGRETSASGANSTAMGVFSEASGEVALAIGASTEAIGNYSTALGRGTNANSSYATVIGRYNLDSGSGTLWNESDPLFQIGNGSSVGNRNNALTVNKDGSQTVNSNSYGLSINTGSDTGDFGIFINNPGGYGLAISSPGDDGIFVSAAANDGIYASGLNAGGRFLGETVGVYATASITSPNGTPDIILGSPSNSALNDDGVLSTNPERASSDLFLRSYDAVVVELDYDNNEGGNFRIRNGNEDVIFDVTEAGNLDINGRLQIGTETIEDSGSDELSFNASLLPDDDNNFRLGNASNRWLSVWAADGTVNTSDRREKKNIELLDYGLEEVLKMNPVTFNWKKGINPDTKIGLIAQDLKRLVPEVVKSHIWEQDKSTGVINKTELDRLGVYYSDLVPVLINAIKEQQQIIENEKTINAKQNLQLEALLSRIEILESKSSN